MKPISAHECRFYLALRARGRAWQTARELATAAQVSERAAREYARRHCQQGTAERLVATGGYRYRPTSKRAADLIAATAALGLS